MLTDTIPRELTRQLLDALESDADIAMRRDAFNALRDCAFPIQATAIAATPPQTFGAENAARPADVRRWAKEMSSASIAAGEIESAPELNLTTLLRDADKWVIDSKHWAKKAHGLPDDGTRCASDLIFDLATAIRRRQGTIAMSTRDRSSSSSSVSNDVRGLATELRTLETAFDLHPDVAHGLISAADRLDVLAGQEAR